MLATRLPTPSTSLIGREREIEQLQTLLLVGDVRLLTLTGPGGVGKSRLATEVASRLGRTNDGQIRFVSLASLHDPSHVAPLIGSAFGVNDANDASLPEALSFALKDESCLIVVDNFEHLLPAATLIAACVEAAPTLSIIATSRTRLRISREREFAVSPLPLPESDGPRENKESSSAVDLFLERSGLDAKRLVRQDWEAAAEICRRVDGLPLAIELAAAKTRLLSLPELLARLDNPWPLLDGGPRDVPARLQSMRNAISWSYELLTESEQALLRMLSVFSGGFTLADAEDLSNRAGDEIYLESVQALLDYSLITADESSAPHRFRMLETVREFGLDELRASQAEDALRELHAEVFVSRFEDSLADVWYAGQPRYAGDEDNLRSALQWSIGMRDGRKSARLALMLAPFWFRQGFFTEARNALSAVLPLTEGESLGIREALIGHATEFAYQQSDFAESVALAEKSLVLSRELNDPARVQRSLRCVAWGGLLDPPRAIRPSEELVEMARASNDKQSLIMALHVLTMTKVYNDSLSEAIEHAEESVRVFESLSNPSANLQGHAKGILGSMALYSGDLPRARKLLSEALVLRRQAGNRVYEFHCLRDLGRVELASGNRAIAAGHFSEALELAWLLGSNHGKAFCYVEAASVSPEAEIAARLLGAESAILARIGLASIPTERRLREETTAEARLALGESRFESQFEAGRTMSPMQCYQDARQALSSALDRAHDTPLSPREREVLVLITQGKSDREIGELLFVSRRTAATHSANVLSKLGVHSRAEATAWAVRNNVV